MSDSTFVLEAENLVGWQEPDTDALTGEAGLVGFVDESELNILLTAWAALPGVQL